MQDQIERLLRAASSGRAVPRWGYLRFQFWTAVQVVQPRPSRVTFPVTRRFAPNFLELWCSHSYATSHAGAGTQSLFNYATVLLRKLRKLKVKWSPWPSHERNPRNCLSGNVYNVFVPLSGQAQKFALTQLAYVLVSYLIMFLTGHV
jgi:hypothetical protein